jgi:hypothetical protein
MGHAINLRYRLLGLVSLLLVVTTTVFPQTEIKPGFNLFSVDQDVEMGKDASKEVEKKLLILNDSVTQRYVTDLGLSLAKNTDMPNLPWQFKVVNSSDVNAFALPGGFVYVNRGLIETAETEGELAGVLGHEISHVTLRHGTNQLSKAYLAQAPLAILGGVLGGGWQAAITRLGASFVINSLFLRFSRTDETQADIKGTQLMTRAGYNPNQMAKMFETLQHLQGRNPSKVEEFFSDHPSPEHRIERIDEEIAKLPRDGGGKVTSRRFESIRDRLKAMPPAPKAKPEVSGGDRGSSGPPPAPSREFRVYQAAQGLYEIPYPSNWEAYQGGDASVTLAPPGGIRQTNNQTQVAYGAMVDVFQLEKGRSQSLDAATDRLISQLLQANSYLRQTGRSHGARLGGETAVSVTLEGTPPQQNYTERVTVVTRRMGDNLLYVAFVTPRDQASTYESTFREMMRGLRVSP